MCCTNMADRSMRKVHRLETTFNHLLSVWLMPRPRATSTASKASGHLANLFCTMTAACLNITFPMHLIEIEYQFNHHKDKPLQAFFALLLCLGGTLVQRQLLLREDWGESKVPRSMTWLPLLTMDPAPSRRT
jgi:hypothetical protein